MFGKSKIYFTHKSGAIFNGHTNALGKLIFTESLMSANNEKSLMEEQLAEISAEKAKQEGQFRAVTSAVEEKLQQVQVSISRLQYL